ncbi:head fiber protein [Bifidobacterium amazonense]|uniref:Head fiber protein n=1 Tax=Bifidobacterium amazonense TaxID=2809027 RepID=A0ABS9VSD3_9BIFI|nr:head fiber protein [Bifidobacterium amazonense]MCH9274996.1 head fiber protein [Bifidobacterium amazonense]
MSQAVEFHHLTSGVANDARQAVIETQFLDDDGNPIDLTGGSDVPATVAWDAVTGKPATYPASVSSISGAGATGLNVLKAGTADAARTAIGAGTPYTLPAATAAALGGIKKASGVTAISTADPAAAAGDAPTKAEYDALVALCAELKAKYNTLVSAGKTAGFLA